MNTKNWQKFRKIETVVLGILLYGIVLVYFYQFFQTTKHGFVLPDEFLYYLEAKAISAHNIYQTPFSLDGNVSFVGNFGGHGICYAIKDGLLAKLFLQPQDPPMLLINFLTCMAMLSLILLFKPFSLNTRLKIALVVATHYILYFHTFSYMQVTIQSLFAVLALRTLYLLYQQPNNTSNKYIYYYLIIIVLAMSFRFTWVIWGLGLFPLATNFKSFIKWMLVLIGLMAFARFLGRYIDAPNSYHHFVDAENASILNSLISIWHKFISNIQLYFSPDGRPITTCMRYLLPILLLINSWFAIAKRNKYTITCTLIGWCYFLACLAFFVVDTVNDERFLSVLSPVLAFSLIGSCNSFIFYPIIAFQLWLFPAVVKETNLHNIANENLNASSPERISKEASYSKLIDLIPDGPNVVINIPNNFTYLGHPNYIFNFPLVTRKGYPIHYHTTVNGQDLRNIYHPNYKLTLFPDPPQGNNQLIYSDGWMCLYRLL